MKDRDATRSTIITSQLPAINGTRTWAPRRSPTLSSIASCTMRLRSRSKARPDARRRRHDERRRDGPWTLPDRWTRRRAHRSLENRADAVSHERPPPLLVW